jgi:hypothetical protein
MRRTLLLAVAASCLIAAGCRTAVPTEPSSSSGETPDPDAEITAAAMGDDMSGIPEALAAQEAFALELGIEPADVTVIDAEAVTWSDSSLGCGQPGQSYLQVLTPGYRVTVSAGDETAVYHTDRAGPDRPATAVRCDKPRITGPYEPVEPPPVSAMVAPALEKARTDLVGRLGAEAEIALESVGVADVTDLVCDDEAQPTRDVGRPAKVIFELQLKTGGEVHVYRAWSDEIRYCGTVPGPAVE